MHRVILFFGAFFGMSSVGLGAFGAHGLKGVLSPEQLATFETAVRYQMYHSFAMILAGMAWNAYGHALFQSASWLFFAGVLLFSGSLYLLTMTGASGLGMITPFGGFCFIMGWVFLGLGYYLRTGSD